MFRCEEKERSYHLFPSASCCWTVYPNWASLEPQMILDFLVSKLKQCWRPGTHMSHQRVSLHWWRSTVTESCYPSCERERLYRLICMLHPWNHDNSVVPEGFHATMMSHSQDVPCHNTSDQIVSDRHQWRECDVIGPKERQ